MKIAAKSLLPLSSLLILAGCGVGVLTSNTASSPVTMAAGFQGKVIGGQQPVVNTYIQLYAVGTSGYASTATALLPASTAPNAVLTNSSGAFTIPAITCPAPNSLLYIVGTGGDPIPAVGNTPAVANNNLSLMAAIGTCSNYGGLTSLTVNELTTIASVWALSPFMTGITNIGAPPVSSATPLVPSLGITNAFATVNKLVNVNTGILTTPPTNTTLPTTQINTLADILENCVNSPGISYSGCSNLFNDAGKGGSTDTITAAMMIAQNPSTNVPALNMLRPTAPAYSPSYSVNSPPTDWSLVVTYAGGGLSNPQGIAADQSGNIWVANQGNSSVSEFNPAGTALSPPTGFTAGGINAPYALAVDQSGYIWVANSGNNTITKLTTGTSGTPYGSSTYLSTPKGIAIDGSGNVWVSNSGNSTVAAFNSSGTAITGSPFSGAGITTPVAIAINPK